MPQLTNQPDLPEEHRLTINFNGTSAGTLICSPDRMADLAIGWAFAQGLKVDETTRVDLTEDLSGTTINIGIEPDAEYPWHRYLLGGFDASVLAEGGAISVPNTAAMDENSFEMQLRHAFDEFRSQRGSGGYHHAALISESELVISVVDISRHNAVDKVVGHLVRNGIRPDHLAIILSGRISADIALKGARAGVPIIATRSLPTRQAVELADASNLMLICRALDHRRVTFGPDRLR